MSHNTSVCLIQIVTKAGFNVYKPLYMTITIVHPYRTANLESGNPPSS